MIATGGTAGKGGWRVQMYDFFKGRWLALLIIAPLIAGIGVAVVLIGQSKPMYEAHGETAVPEALSATPADFIVVSRGPARADFRNAIGSEGTARYVARVLHMPISEVRGHLSSTVVSAEVTGVQVIFTAKRVDLARRGLEDAARSALLSIAQGQRDIAQRSAVATKDLAAQADAGVASLEERTHLRDVEAGYRQSSSDISGLETLIANSGKDKAAVANLTGLLAQRNAERDAYGAVLTQYQDAIASRDKARANADDAQIGVAHAASVVDSLAHRNLVTSERVVKVARAGSILSSVGLAVVVTFALVLGLALLSKRRQQGRRASGRGITEVDVREPTIELHESSASSRTSGASVP